MNNAPALAPDVTLLQVTDTPEETTTEKLLRLKDDRAAIKQESDSLSLQLSEKRAKFDAMIETLEAGFNEENAPLIQSVTIAEQEFERKDKELRAAVVAAWPGGTAPKTIADGLSVRVATKPVYDDTRAIEWAIEKNLPNLLSLNKTEFKKAAEALKPAFVTVESTITAVIKD